MGAVKLDACETGLFSDSCRFGKAINHVQNLVVR